MKLFKSFALVLCLLSTSFYALASEGDSLNVEVAKKVVSQQIVSQFDFPEALIGTMNNSSVVVKFQVDENKQLKVLSLDCTDSFFKMQLIKELEDTKLFLPQGMEEFEFTMELLFKTSQL